jgi:hypothetical protein
MSQDKPRYLSSLCRLPVALAVFWVILAPAYSWLVRPLDNMSIMTVDSLQWNYYRAMLPRLVGLAAFGGLLAAWAVSVWFQRRKTVVKSLWAWRIGKVAGIGATLLTVGYLFIGLLASGMPGNVVDSVYPDELSNENPAASLPKTYKLLPLNFNSTVPEFAHIAGMYVGYSTMNWMERYYGPGHPYTGGHPQSGREWRSRETDWFLNADGKNYSDGKNAPRGRTVDFIVVTAQESSSDSPSISLTPAQCEFMGCVRPGITRAEVMTILKDKLPPPAIEYDNVNEGDAGKARHVTLRWEARGYVRLNENAQATKTNWVALLKFVNERLVSILISS